MKDTLSTNNTQSSLVITRRSALGELLLALADDEFVTGYANSEWTGIAPLIEEDLAFSSLAQDELGHARLLYELLADLEGLGDGSWELGDGECPTPNSHLLAPDSHAYGRGPSSFRN